MKPSLFASFVHLPRAEEIISDITFCIDKVMSWCYRMRGMEHQLEPTMRDALRRETARVKTIRSRMQRLAGRYNEFLQLREEEARRRARIQRLLVMLGPWNTDSKTGDFLETEAQQTCGVLVNTGKELVALRASLPLWQAMREYLSFVPEARIAEMEEFFDKIKFSEGNRQAIESALKRHPKVFRTRKNGREKFIALKEWREE